MGKIRARVTRWNKRGFVGRSGPVRCEVSFVRSLDNVVMQIDAGDRRMFVIFENDLEADAAERIIEAVTGTAVR